MQPRSALLLAVALLGAPLALTGCSPTVAADVGEVGSATTADLEYLTPFGTPTRPFSPAVRVGDVIFLSGQIGTDASATGALVAGGIEAETRQTMQNIKRTLEAVGSGMDRVVKCTVMMADMGEWDRMNTVYREFFPADRLPARSAFGATALALGARVEIECFATR
jgi:reactive intermediate/imine deaminase